MYVEVNAKEALEAYADGKRVVCLERDDDIKGVVNAFSLASLLNGFAFLVDKAEPEKHNHVPEPEDETSDEPVLPPPKAECEPVQSKCEADIKPEKSTSGAKVDVGKILALHNAGWNYAKIADEMRLTVKQVGNYIYRYKNKEIKGE